MIQSTVKTDRYTVKAIIAYYLMCYMDNTPNGTHDWNKTIIEFINQLRNGLNISLLRAKCITYYVYAEYGSALNMTIENSIKQDIDRIAEVCADIITDLEVYTDNALVHNEGKPTPQVKYDYAINAYRLAIRRAVTTYVDTNIQPDNVIDTHDIDSRIA